MPKHFPARNVTNMSAEDFNRHRSSIMRRQVLQMNADLAEFRAIRQQYGDNNPNNPFLIKNSGAFLRFDLKDGKVTNPRNVPLEQASRFNRTDADNIAAILVDNDTGSKSEVVHMFQALDEVIAGFAGAIETITAEADKIDAALAVKH